MRERRLSSIAKATLCAGMLVTCVLPTAVGAAAHDSVPWRTTLNAGQERLTVHDLSGAEAYFRQALASVKHQSPRATDEIVECMQKLASVLQMENMREEGSLALYKQALKLSVRMYGKNDSRLIPLINAIGDIYAQDVNYAQAKKYFSRSLQLTKEPFTIATDEDALGKIASGVGDTSAAERHFSAALSTLMTQPELRNTDSLQQAISDYIDLCMHRDNASRNIAFKFQSELLKDRLATLQQTQSTPQSEFAKAVTGMVVQNGRITDLSLPTVKADRPIPDFVALESSNQQRVDFYERMIETDIKSLGPKHPSVARDLTGLAAVYIRNKDYAKAKPLLARALEIYSTVYGAEALLSRKTAALMTMIAETEKDAQHLAIDDGGGGFVNLLVAVPPQSGKLEIALGLNYLGELLFSLGKTEEAARVFSWALADTVMATGDHSVLTAAALADYGKVMRSTGQLKLADEMEGASKRILRNLKTQEAVMSLP